MKKTLIITFVSLIGNLTATGQNLFLIGEKSYPCTNAITLKTNSDDGDDLNVFVAKNGKSGLFGVSTKIRIPEDFTGKLIIYLDDGNVVTCNASVATERVDDDAKALYNLTDDQLNKLKASNIHTAKYTLTWLEDKNFSASNKGIQTKDLISEFFKE
jgi:hypothetical protein